LTATKFLAQRLASHPKRAKPMEGPPHKGDGLFTAKFSKPFTLMR